MKVYALNWTDGYEGSIIQLYATQELAESARDIKELDYYLHAKSAWLYAVRRLIRNRKSSNEMASFEDDLLYEWKCKPDIGIGDGRYYVREWEVIDA